MRKSLNPFRPPEHAVLSLQVQAQMPNEQRERTRFEVLVRHLFDRFLNNELMATDGETSRAMQLGYVVALPGLLFALFLFPAYHAPAKRAYWPQVSDHYFYVVFSVVVMGIVTVSQWDLLFPDLLDVFVLSVLPIKRSRLLQARVVALAIFLGLVLLGTNSLGAIFLPMIADLPSLPVHLFAHFAAVIMGGTFAAAFFLALQGLLLNLVGERWFRRATPPLQAASITVLLTVLFLSPAIADSLAKLLGSGDAFVRYFPPFWFLGIYQRLLDGGPTPPIFRQLARSGCWATLLTICVVLATYPLADRRRVRQLVEGPARGPSGNNLKTWPLRPIHGLLHATVLRLPAGRAIFHFIGQTLIRNQRHRLLLSMYGGLGMALALAGLIAFTIPGSRGHAEFLPSGIDSAVPILAFWTVAGLRTALAAPIDRRPSWVFRVTGGRANLDHLNGAKVWVTLWALVIGIAAVAILGAIAPAGLRTPLATGAQVLVAVGLALLLTDCLFLNTVTIPFTSLRKAAITDMPLVVIRYFVVFPVLVMLVSAYQPWLQRSFNHLIEVVLLLAAAHFYLRWKYNQRVREMRMGSEFEDEDQLFQELGLRD